MRRIALFVFVLSCLLTGAAFCVPIGQAKTLPLGSSATVTGSMTLIEPTECYLESTNGTSGIWVQANTTGFSLGSVVNAAGVVGASDGEIVLQSASLSSAGEPKTMSAVGMTNISLGGRCNTDAASLQDFLPYEIPGDGIGWHWEATKGLSNAGLLVTTWGKVTAVCYSPASDAHWFHIDDGSRVRCDYGDSGVIVYSDSDVSEGDYIRVTGVSSVEVALDDASKLVRVIRTRSGEDVSCVKKLVVQPLCPFSDEFNSAVLDPRWVMCGDTGGISLTSSPGFLALSPYVPSNYIWQPCIVQATPGNWDMELKVTPRFSATAEQSRGFSILLAPPTWKDRYTNYDSLVSIGSIADTSSAATVTPVGGPGWTLYGETYWIRVRMRRPAGSQFGPGSVSVSVSSADFAHAVSQQYGDCTPECSGATSYDYLVMRSYAMPYDASFAPLIDYIRFTRLDQ